MTEKLKNEPVRGIRLILKTELNSKNRVAAFSMVGILVITYSLNIIDWNLCKVKTKMMATYSMHHPKADIHRLYLPRSNGGRELLKERERRLSILPESQKLYWSIPPSKPKS